MEQYVRGKSRTCEQEAELYDLVEKHLNCLTKV